MTVVCLDTNIVIWGVLKQKRDPNQQSFVDKSTALVKYLVKSKDIVLLPSVVVGELLVKISQEEHDDVVESLSRDWKIVDFDSRAASKFAQMRYERLSPQMRRKLKRENPSATNRELDADTMIAATALVHKATRIYTNDRQFKNMAKEYIEVLLLDDLDLPGDQLGLNLPDPDPDE